MNTLLKLYYKVRTILLFLALIILILFSVVSVYAEPEKKDPEPGSWIEVVCTVVPEDFEGSVSIVVSDVETDESHTIDCLKANGFVGRKKLPYGKYFVDRIYTSDTFYYEGFTDLYSFELTNEMTAAKKIEIEVIKNNVPDDVFTMTPEEQPDAELADNNLSEEDTGHEKGSDEEAPEIGFIDDKAETEQGSGDSTNDGSLQEEISSEDPLTVKSVLRNIGISLLVTVVFVVGVALIVYFVRSKYFEEE